jgi:hypothetical protein
MIEQWVIDRLNPLKAEKLIILAWPVDGHALKRRILGKWGSMPAELIVRQGYSHSPDRSAELQGRVFCVPVKKTWN